MIVIYLGVRLGVLPLPHKARYMIDIRMIKIVNCACILIFQHKIDKCELETRFSSHQIEIDPEVNYSGLSVTF